MSWICRAFVYSGQQNPKWEVIAESALAIVAEVKKLPVIDIFLPGPAKLGFSGCSMYDTVTDTLYVTSEDKITIDTLSDSEIHEDKQRVIEEMLLSTAPEEIQDIVKAMR